MLPGWIGFILVYRQGPMGLEGDMRYCSLVGATHGGGAP